MAIGAAYAKGKWALGECARSGRKMLLRDMIADGYYPNLIVDPVWYEPKHPQESLPSVRDPTALFRPAPDRSFVGGVVNFDGVSGLDPVPGGGFGADLGGGTGATTISHGYELARLGVDFSSGSFAIAPIVLRDQVLEFTGNVSFRNDVRFEPGNSALETRFPPNSVGTVDSVPLQYHTNRPGSLPTPPEGAGHDWRVRWIAEFGPDPWEFTMAAIDVWVILNTTRSNSVARPPSGTAENTGVFQIASFLTSGPTLVKLYAQANITVRYVRV